MRAAAAVSADWHACFSASYRRYRYTLHNGRLPNLFLAPWSWHRYQVRLDEDLMRHALEGMLGRHDFAAFERAGSSRSHSVTTLQEVSVLRRGDLIEVELQASGFLYGMVRLVMGQLVALAEGRLALATFERRWRSGAREEDGDEVQERHDPPMLSPPRREGGVRFALLTECDPWHRAPHTSRVSTAARSTCSSWASWGRTTAGPGWTPT